jgi:hypothetical protein
MCPDRLVGRVTPLSYKQGGSQSNSPKLETVYRILQNAELVVMRVVAHRHLGMLIFKHRRR